MEKIKFFNLELESTVLTLENLLSFDQYHDGLLNPSILMLCGLRSTKDRPLLDCPEVEILIRDWQKNNPQRYLVVFHDRYLCKDSEPTREEIWQYAEDYQGWVLIDRVENFFQLFLFDFKGDYWPPDTHARIPANRHNIQLVKVALAKARQKTGRRFSLNRAISTQGGVISISSGYGKVDGIASRLLVHDWQKGRLENMAPMKYPALIYHRYYTDGGHLGQEWGYLYPDGSFRKVGGQGIQYLPVDHPDGGRGMYCDTSYGGERPKRLSELEV